MNFWEKLLPEDQQFFARAIYDSMLASGFPPFKELSLEEGLKYMTYFIQEHPDLILERFQFTTSYTDDLLEQARAFVATEKYEFAIMFYATWIEHSLNALIANELRAQGSGQDAIEKFIRTSTVKKKVTSAWAEVFRGEIALNADLASGILAVAETRNEFAHYKWRTSGLADDLELHEQSKQIVSTAEQSVDQILRVQVEVARRRELPRGQQAT